MEKNVYSIEEIFAGKCFNIPDYQRGFTWEKNHCIDLLDDLDLLPEGFNHYTGTVVLHSNKKEFLDAEGSKYYGFDIVDGQQRITSIVILLQVVQSYFRTQSNYQTLAAGITKKFISANRQSDNNAFYKLILNSDCGEFFITDILGTPGLAGATIKSHQRLLVAKETFNTYLRLKQEELGNNFYNWLINFYEKIIQRLKAGIYFVDQAAEVGVIFEVMNNRGKELTELEKVKNYLLYLTTKISLKTRNELASNINNTWSNIYRRFMSAGLNTESENQFLRAHWLMYSNYNRKDWVGSKSIKNKYNLKDYRNRDIDLFNDLESYVKSLDYASIAFADLENPERADSFNVFNKNEIKRSVVFYSTKLLRTKTIASFRSLMMACRLRFPKDATLYLNLVQLVEKFAFRVYNMQGKRADTGQSTLLKIAYELYNEIIDYKNAFKQLRKLLYLYSSPSLFNKFFSFNADENNWYSWGALKYFLYEYEEHLAGGDPLAITWTYFTENTLENSIEHILPQKPEDDKKYWRSRFNKKQIKLLTHDLGNLCLTYNNSSYKNFGFDRKRGKPSQESPCYANSSLNQERRLTSFREWNPNSIKRRREQLKRWALERWHVDLEEFIMAEIIEEELDELLNENDSSI